MSTISKADFPTADIRQILEPGPVVLVSSAWKGQRNVMTMGWHMMLGFSPALFACYIWPSNHSHELISRSGECVVNVPTRSMLDAVIGIGNSSAADGRDKFDEFGLTAVPADRVKVPLVGECYANFECRLADGRQVARYGLFIWEVVKAHVAVEPAHPETLHYMGKGEFMVAGKVVNCRRRFLPQNL